MKTKQEILARIEKLKKSIIKDLADINEDYMLHNITTREAYIYSARKDEYTINILLWVLEKPAISLVDKLV